MAEPRFNPRLVRKLPDSLGEAICAALDDPAVVETMLNPCGRIFVERWGSGISIAGAMPAGAAEIIIGSVPHALRSEADEDRPIISGELPTGGHRSNVLPRTRLPCTRAISVDMARLLKSTMRFRPDRIVGGAARDGAALTLLKASNTGLPA